MKKIIPLLFIAVLSCNFDVTGLQSNNSNNINNSNNTNNINNTNNTNNVNNTNNTNNQNGVCGDGVIDAVETCDGTNFGTTSCSSLGYYGSGSLVCDDSCHIDYSNCDRCGDGIIQGNEECDGPTLGDHSCMEHNERDPYGGNVLCNSGCSTMDYSSCEPLGWQKIATGATFACGLLYDGSVWCWGLNGNSELGHNDTADIDRLPRQIDGLTAIDIETGRDHACAILTNNTVQCWGRGQNGKLGNDDNQDSADPVDVVGLTNAVELALGEKHSCARTSNNEIWCWGRNNLYQLGNGGIINQESRVPVQVVLDVASPAIDKITAGQDHSCVLLNSGDAYCWGKGGNGQLGNGSTANASTPIQVNAGTDLFSDVVAGWNYTCGIIIGDTAKCWGDNSNGQLGDASLQQRNSPVTVQNVGDISELSANFNHTCVVKNSGDISCWGLNDNHAFGLVSGNTGVQYFPTDTEVVHNAVHIGHTANQYNCIIADDSSLHCWGLNGDGQGGILSNGKDLRIPYKVTDYYKLGNCTDQNDNDSDGLIDDLDPDCAPYLNGSIYQDFVNGTENLDLQNKTLTFTPNSSGLTYNYLVSDASSLVVIPGSGGVDTRIAHLEDDDFEKISLGNLTIPFFNNTYSTIYLNSNAIITFEAPTIIWDILLWNFFNGPPAVALLWNDFLSGGNSGDVQIDIFSDKIAFSFVDFSIANTGDNTITAQVVLNSNGVIELTYLTCQVIEGITGITLGNGSTDLGEVNFLQ